MAYPPKQTFNVRDRGLGLVSAISALPLIVGASSAGTNATLYQFSDPQSVQDTLGEGPTVELALPVIEAAGGCLVLKTAASTAGTAGSVTPTRVSTSTGTITTAGAPRDGYEVIVEITATGTLGTGKFRYSLDDGYTYTGDITIPGGGGTYTLGDTGVTLTFVAGGGPIFFEDGDTHAFDCVAPHYTTSDLSTAWTELLANLGTRKVRQAYFTGKNATAAGAATMAAAVATHMGTLKTNHYFARAIMDAGNDTAANVLTSFASFSDARVMLVFGDADIVTLNAQNGWGVPKVPAMNAVAERAAAAKLSENLGRRLSGALRGVRAISHDEGKTTLFNEADKITTLMTERGQAGFWVTNSFLRSALGSDFKFWEWGRVIDELCDTIYGAQETFKLSSLDAVNDGTGHIHPISAALVETAVKGAIKARLLDPINAEGTKGHVSAASYAVDQTNDFLATQELLSNATAVPRPPITGITTGVGFARS